MDPLAHGERLDFLNGVLQDLLDPGGVDGEGIIPRLHLGQVEQIVDQPEELVGVDLDNLEEAFLLGRDGSGDLVLHEAGRFLERRERAPQLVRETRDEIRLHPVEISQLLGHLVEGPGERAELVGRRVVERRRNFPRRSGGSPRRASGPARGWSGR